MMQYTDLKYAPEHGQKRDAIHIAVLPARAAITLYPGQRVKVILDDNEYKAEPSVENNVGIVNPFVSGAIQEGDLVWILLEPGSVEDMTHHWVHPSIPEIPTGTNASEMSSHEVFMRHFADQVGLSYELALEVGDDYVDYGNYHTLNFDTPSCAYDASEQYWKAWAHLRGRKIPATLDMESTPFSCAC